MGPPLRSFAADADDCIMVRVLGPTGYKVVARLIRARKRAPLWSSSRPHQAGRRARSCQGMAWQERRMPQGRGDGQPWQRRRAPALQYCGSGRRNGIPGQTKKPIKKASAHSTVKCNGRISGA